MGWREVLIDTRLGAGGGLEDGCGGCCGNRGVAGVVVAGWQGDM